MAFRASLASVYLSVQRGSYPDHHLGSQSRGQLRPCLKPEGTPPHPGHCGLGTHSGPRAPLSRSWWKTQEPEGGRARVLTAFRWTVGFVLTGDSGCPRAGVGEGLAGWDGAFFPDCSSLASDRGLFTPAMPPTGTRHTESGAPAPHAGSERLWGHPWSRFPGGTSAQPGTWSRGWGWAAPALWGPGRGEG